MPDLRPLSELQRNRVGVEALIAPLLVTNKEQSKAAGLHLAREAGSYGLSVKDYLILAVDPTKSANPERFKVSSGPAINGFEAALIHAGLPLRNDFENGVVFQAASDTFSTFDGTRALFPAVFDQILRFATRQNAIERVEPMLAGSRTISSVELISTVIDDDSKARNSFTIAEGADIPIRQVRSSEKSVKMYKHGSGYGFTYEFGRRVGLDILTPFANRVTRQLELSKVLAATGLMLNGDTVAAAASVVDQSTFDSPAGVAATANQLSYRHLLCWLVSRAKAGVPVDTVIGDYDSYVQWLLMFSPVTGITSEAAALADAGLAPRLNQNVPSIMKDVSFVISSGANAKRLLGITKGETCEELVEAGANIVESERAVINQTITFVKSEVTGYRLPFADTRQEFDYSA